MDSHKVRALLDPLLDGAPGDLHILTLLTTSSAYTCLRRRLGVLSVEHPEVVDALGAALLDGVPGTAVLRTFTDRTSHTLPDGRAVPLKSVCGWRLDGGGLHPLDARGVAAVARTDALTGRRLPPERGVGYADAWPVDLARFHAPARR
ncbi:MULTISPECIES: hypothetical protein [Nocardiopsis]|jgi:hypothetical protein|uniref:Uncharacterized protein n=1 Tax=Nocardiopsis tropica TaxID=109330 RepID=A0ABU7KZ36_9ACTN|nr:hypothetical protein [Nocardiopsis umidischolae]MEE2054530.1 hypothetical protein [Nocardiopsis umidischolae]